MQYLNKIKFNLILALSLMLGACGQIDVSTESKYKVAIGQKFKTKSDLLAIGVTADKNYKKNVDYIVLVSEPGFSGPEVIFRDFFSKGKIVEVVKILKSSSVFLSRVIYIVRVVGKNKYVGTEIRVEMIGEIDDSNYGLGSLVYKNINNWFNNAKNNNRVREKLFLI